MQINKNAHVLMTIRGKKKIIQLTSVSDSVSGMMEALKSLSAVPYLVKKWTAANWTMDANTKKKQRATYTSRAVL